MMNRNFDRLLDWVLVHEGGYVDHPADPGGATMRGVTQRTYDAWRARRGIPRRSVRMIDDDELRQIYRGQYWDAIRGDQLPPGVDYAVFDFAVHSGPARSAKALQRAIGAAPDGIIGELTLQRLSEAAARPLIRTICEQRVAWMRTLSTWRTFGRGWQRRVMGQRDGAQEDDDGVIDRAMMLARALALPPAASPIPRPRQAAPGKARVEDLSALRRALPCLRVA